MNALVIGYGSIGQRHTRLLRDMGIEVSVVSKRFPQDGVFFNSLSTALQSKAYDYVIIANETSAHIEALQKVLNSDCTGTILVEKPLFSKNESITLNGSKVFVAYNFRFHPLIIQLKEMLQNERVLSVNAYVGQYLPSWRPSTDYTKCYSASRQQGGGVLRDLSHELDYLTLLFGQWQALHATTTKISSLEIDSEDYVQASYVTHKNIHISVELNYIDRISQRYLVVHTDHKTIKIDFINHYVNVNGEVTELDKIDRDYTYIEQHKSILRGSSRSCSFAEGIEVVNMIEAVEKSSLLKEWVYNE
ncbi:Gfo/Idh/MocA family protein [Paenibacillus sp. TH7-28]